MQRDIHYRRAISRTKIENKLAKSAKCSCKCKCKRPKKCTPIEHIHKIRYKSTNWEKNRMDKWILLIKEIRFWIIRLFHSSYRSKSWSWTFIFRNLNRAEWFIRPSINSCAPISLAFNVATSAPISITLFRITCANSMLTVDKVPSIPTVTWMAKSSQNAISDWSAYGNCMPSGEIQMPVVRNKCIGPNVTRLIEVNMTHVIIAYELNSFFAPFLQTIEYCDASCLSFSYM